jgi:hypothetical protein
MYCACLHFRREFCLDVNGGHFEHLQQEPLETVSVLSSLIATEVARY